MAGVAHVPTTIAAGMWLQRRDRTTEGGLQHREVVPMQDVRDLE
jgi:hypothetical protein